MEKEEFINAIKEIGEGATIEYGYGEETTIENGSDFIGGIDDTFMNELLGNKAYPTIEMIAEVLYNYITNELNEEITFIY